MRLIGVFLLCCTLAGCGDPEYSVQVQAHHGPMIRPVMETYSAAGGQR